MNKISVIGIDIVNVSRFKIKLLEDNLKFYEKIFSDSEIVYCKNSTNFDIWFSIPPSNHYASEDNHAQ